MKHVTLASDTKYLLFALTLIRSVQKHSSIPLTFHYYCLDQNTFEKIQKLKLQNVIVYRPETLVSNEILILREKTQRQKLTNLKKKEYHYFCWSIASVFSNYIMNNVQCDSVTYIDADIMFHKDLNLIFNEIGDKDVGIFKHRFLEDNEECPYGKYNVGVVYFKNSKKGQALLSWWADSVVFKKYPEYATWGDQKYLEYFPKVCSSEEIYIDENIGHGAPWQWQCFEFDKLKDGIIKWRGKEEPLVFTHFSKFVYDLEKNTFFPTSIYQNFTLNNKVFENPDLYALHANYFEELKISNKLLNN
jgi:hypothetical protein